MYNRQWVIGVLVLLCCLSLHSAQELTTGWSNGMNAPHANLKIVDQKCSGAGAFIESWIIGVGDHLGVDEQNSPVALPSVLSVQAVCSDGVKLGSIRGYDRNAALRNASTNSLLKSSKGYTRVHLRETEGRQLQHGTKLDDEFHVCDHLPAETG